MSSSSDVRARRPRIVRADAVGLAVLPELPPAGAVVVDVTDEPTPVDASYEAGFADGHAAALGAAVAAATAEARAATARAEQLAASIADSLHEVRNHAAAELDAVASEVAEAALLLAEAIVGRSLAGEVPAAAALARALDLVPSGEPAVARLHPDDVELVGVPARPDLRVVADPAVHPGGCIVDAGASSVDGGIAAAIDRVRAALLEDGDEPW